MKNGMEFQRGAETYMAMVAGRDIAIEGCIKACKEIAELGGSAEQCVQRLERVSKGLTKAHPRIEP